MANLLLPTSNIFTIIWLELEAGAITLQIIWLLVLLTPWRFFTPGSLSLFLMWFSIFLVIAISTKNNPLRTLVSWLLLLQCSWPLFYLKYPIPHLYLRHWKFYFILLIILLILPHWHILNILWFLLINWFLYVGWLRPSLQMSFLLFLCSLLCALIQYHDINAFSSLMTLKFMSPAQTCPLNSDSYLFVFSTSSTWDM